MTSVHAVRTGYGDTSSRSDGTPSVSTSVPPPVPTNPHASMNRISSRYERNAWDLLVGPVHLLTSDVESRRPPDGNEAFQIEFEHCPLQMIKCKRVKC
jgi:hypothetical protein